MLENDSAMEKIKQSEHSRECGGGGGVSLCHMVGPGRSINKVDIFAAMWRMGWRESVSGRGEFQAERRANALGLACAWQVQGAARRLVWLVPSAWWGKGEDGVSETATGKPRKPLEDFGFYSDWDGAPLKSSEQGSDMIRHRFKRSVWLMCWG